jgi:hypothetical protein
MVNEADIERKFYDHVKSTGGVAIKVNPNWYRNYPDRLVIRPGGSSFFLEFKRPGEKPRKGQALVARYLKRRNILVYWTDSLEVAIAIYEDER